MLRTIGLLEVGLIGDLQERLSPETGWKHPTRAAPVLRTLS